MPGSIEQPVTCPDCNGSGTGRLANGLGGQRSNCFKCGGTGEVLSCMKCGAGPDEECECTPDMPDMMPEELDDDPGGPCPECGAFPPAPCDPNCPNATVPSGPDPDRFREGVQENAGFDKFMDRIVLQERRGTKVDGKENNPARLIAGKYQERPLGRIRYGVKR